MIDFGCCGVGDPACDLAIAWTSLSGSRRDTFRIVLGIDVDTCSRGRGWAPWNALICLVDHLDHDSDAAAIPRRVIDSILAEHSQKH